MLLLVGITGAHLDLKMVRRRGATAVKISLAGLLIPLALGIGIAFLLPATMMAGSTTRPTFAMFLGVAMCVSAIPVIAKTLADMNLTHRDVGQLVLTAGMVDDAVGWFLLSVVSAMAVGCVHGWKVALSVGYLIALRCARHTRGPPTGAPGVPARRTRRRVRPVRGYRGRGDHRRCLDHPVARP